MGDFFVNFPRRFGGREAEFASAKCPLTPFAGFFQNFFPPITRVRLSTYANTHAENQKKLLDFWVTYAYIYYGRTDWRSDLKEIKRKKGEKHDLRD